MAFTVVIPARYQSSRLPGKPLADIGGKTMVQRVYEQALLSGAESVIIETYKWVCYEQMQPYHRWKIKVLKN